MAFWWWNNNPYQFIRGSGSCIHSQNGYDYNSTSGWYVAKEGVVYAGTTVWNGTWVFNMDGTGKYSYVLYATVTPPVQKSPCDIPGGIRVFNSIHKDENGNQVNEYKFTYEITPFGDITIHAIEEGDTLEGSISSDRNSIVLFDAPRVKGPGADVCPWWNIICTASRTLIKVHD